MFKHIKVVSNHTLKIYNCTDFQKKTKHFIAHKATTQIRLLQ